MNGADHQSGVDDGVREAEEEPAQSTRHVTRLDQEKDGRNVKQSDSTQDEIAQHRIRRWFGHVSDEETSACHATE